jgi:enoyl-[acyl-carrier-protein] reductase (NADH)
MKQLSIKHITNLHSDSLRGLDFYAQELVILQERLEEILADNTNKEVAEQVEHFQNEFIIHQKAIDDLKSSIHENNTNIKDQISEFDGSIEKITLSDNHNLHEDYLTEERLFNELRHEFYRFASKWM